LIAFGGGYLIAGAGYQALFLLAALLTSLGAIVFALFARKVTPAAINKQVQGDL
jgi:predicted MFS family arabinose efflux permease